MEMGQGERWREIRERMKGECVRGRERCERKGDRERERGIESERKEERERKGIEE